LIKASLKRKIERGRDMTGTIEIRVCTACGEPVESRDYYRLTKDKTRLTSECKKCKKLRRKLYYEKNKKQVNEKHPNTYTKKHVIGDNPIDVFNKTLENLGICWLDELRKYHQERWGKKDEGEN
jgi:hypothetical protein